MTIKIITLCENTATFGCLAEWGLSMWVETDTFRLLLDTGMTDVAFQNSKRYNIDFTALDAIVLSHGHLDHTGGLPYILPHAGPVPVYCHPDVFAPKFSARHLAADENISIPLDRDALAADGRTVHLVKEAAEISPGIHLSGEISMETDFEQLDDHLLTEKNGKHEKDPLRDDLSVAIETERGLFILLGCAHRGVVNIIRHFQRVTGEERVYGIAGGLHLSHADDEHIDQVVRFFEKTNIQKIACSHCTGFNAASRLKTVFPDRFIHNNSGKRLVFN
ncbi:MAG: MBL fold metallo-hydrolase [Deltaproteobacteria bacterium]|nr:MBL fold metallo-hydrolase [Deltaproteobacteria bacterium]MBN2671562.1 MBL fold metallo-hydrolase [Deltaproteobacteria bacterium]